MKISISLLLVFMAFPSNAFECRGHIFFFNLEEGSGEASADFSYYYHEVIKWLPEEGISYSAHTELPLKAKTCFSEEIAVPKTLLDDSLGYVFVKPDSEKKFIGGVLTGVDISLMIEEFFD